MEIYCGQLGMVTEFGYCLSMNEGLPCRNMIGCWGGRMDIMLFLKRTFTEEELQKCFGGLPKSKFERIMEVLQSMGKEE